MVWLRRLMLIGKWFNGEQGRQIHDLSAVHGFPPNGTLRRWESLRLLPDLCS
jgi:hypothetical protein